MEVVECGKDLFEAACGKSSVFIGCSQCFIDTTLQVMRCKDCNRYGYTKKHCQGISEAVNKILKDHPGDCLDCISYNDKIHLAGLSHTRFRDPRHASGGSKCKTWAALKRKFLVARYSSNLEEVAQHI